MKKKTYIVLLLLGAAITLVCFYWWPGASDTYTTVRSPEVLQNVEEVPDLSPRLEDSPDFIDQIRWPKNVVADELLLTFEDEEQMNAYLDALADAGFKNISRLDRLNTLRVPFRAVRRVPPDRFGAKGEFSYRISQPTPPVQIGPSTVGSLQGFNKTALEIAGGSLPGGGAGIVIAVLDSGLSEHPYFDSVDSVTEMDLIGGAVSAEASLHGSAVASIVVGRDGVAPDASLLSIRVLDETGAGRVFDVAQGIIEAVDYGAQVINLSLGVYSDSGVLRNAVEYAQSKGVILVAAGGNDGYGQIAYPAAYDEVVSVTAIDGAGNQAQFPNQSIDLDIAAPGVSILAVDEEIGKAPFSGTSAAAPFVSGTIATMLSEHPERSSAEIVEWMDDLLNEAGAPGSDPLYGQGVLDWDRLREREESDAADVALASIYLSSDAVPGTTMPIELVVQNRGNRWISSSKLEVKLGSGDIREFTVGSLRPGEVTSRKIFTQIPPVSTENTVEVVARVSSTSDTDVRPENDYMGVRYQPVLQK